VNDTKANLSDGESSAADEFVISRVFDAPRHRVWKAWTDAERLAKWWGPKDFDIVSVKLDLRPGGSCHYCLKAPQGQEMWGKLIFREIVPEERLVFVVSFSDAKGGLTRHPMSQDWPLTILSTVTFADTNGKTALSVRWSPYEATEVERKAFEVGRDGMRQGWTGTFDRLTEYLAQS
jgi:uncharacterized protein YndB with AHSA1/START domain